MNRKEIEKILKEKFNVEYIGRYDDLYSSYIVGMNVLDNSMKKQYYMINEDSIEEVIDEKVLKNLKRIYEPEDKNIY